MKRPRPRKTTTSGPPSGTSRDGVDLIQIRYMPSLSPAERLRVLKQVAASLAELRAAAKY